MEVSYRGNSPGGEKLFTEGLKVPVEKGIDPVEGHAEFFGEHKRAIEKLAKLEVLKGVGTDILKGVGEVGIGAYATLITAQGAWGHLHNAHSQEIAMAVAGLATAGAFFHSFLRMINNWKEVINDERDATVSLNSNKSRAESEFWSTHTWARDERGVNIIVSKSKE